MNHKQTKICLVSISSYAYFHPELGIKSGGAEKQIYRASLLLSQNPNYDVSVCVGDFGQEKEVEKFENLTLHKTISYKQNKILGLFKLFKIYCNINPDVFIFRTADTGIALSILWAKFIMHKKIIYFIASNAETTFTQTRKMNSLLTAITMSIAYKAADKIIAQTYQQQKIFFRNRKRKATVIKSIYPLKKEKNTSPKQSILWIGRAIPWKKPLVFMHLAKQFPHENFIMIAPPNKGQERYAQKIKKKANEIPNLQFIEYVVPNQIKKYYQNALVVVNTSVNEGFSNVMFEAMEAQCAILSLNSNPDNFIVEYGIGYVAAGCSDKLAKRLKQILFNQAKTIEMGKKGHQYLIKNHDPQKIANQITNQIEYLTNFNQF